MKLYISHASSFDYQKELYEPLKQSIAKQHQVIFPHDDFIVNTREAIASCDMVIAEVSYPSTGQGIELGWANASSVPIVCIYKLGVQYSSSLPFVSQAFLAYSSTQDMITKLSSWIKETQDIDS